MWAEAWMRRQPRKMVEIPCELVTPYDESPRLCWATDLGLGGVWLDYEPLFVTTTEPLIVCVQPCAGWRRRELMLFARVARISPGRRASDVRGPGIGLSFLDLDRSERHALERWLDPRPPAPPLRPPPERWTAHPFAARLS